MDRYALGLVAALLTLWGAGAIYQGYPDRLAEGLIPARVCCWPLLRSG